MEKNKPYVPPFDREPSKKGFTRILWFFIAFFLVYGIFLIWRNYYAEGAKPPLQRKQLSVPPHMADSTKLDDAGSR